MLKKRMLLVAVCLMAALNAIVPLSARGDEPEDTVVRVGWYESTYCYIDQFGRRNGIAYEYQQKVAAHTGWSYEYVDGSWPNLLQMLMDGEIDLLTDVSYTEERDGQILYSSLPMGSESYYIYIDADNTEINPEDLQTLNGKKIGVNKGSFQEQRLTDWAAENALAPEIFELMGDEADSMIELAQGNIDAIVTLDSFGSKERCVPVCKLSSSDYYFAVNKNRPDLLAELNAALNNIQDEDPYYNQKLFDEYVHLTRTNAFLAPEQEEWLNAHGAIRVGYRDDFMPFCAKDAHGALNGALKDYLAHASNCLKNAKISFEPVPYPTVEAMLDALKRREIDCVFPVNISTSDGEDKGIVVVNPIMKTEMYAVVRSADNAGVSFHKDMTVALNAGNINCETFLKDFFPEWKIVVYPNTDRCLQAVASKEADCVLISNYRITALEDMRAHYKLSSLPTGETMNLSIAVRRSDHHLYYILNKIANLTNVNDIDSALAAYLLFNQQVSFGKFLRDNWVIVTVFITAVFAVILILLNQKLRAERRYNERQRQIINERLEHQRERQEALERELHQQEELESAMHKVNTDPLTGVKSKHAYIEAEKQMDRRIAEGTVSEFAVVVFDLNNLKGINDTLGHEAGDEYIRAGCELICARFKHSPVYRVGSDEFVAILEAQDYANRFTLLDGFEKQMSEHQRRGEIVVADGCSVFRPGRDSTLHTVFERADEKMYQRKKALKSMRTR